MKTKKLEPRLKRKQRIRNKISGTAERPRLCVYRSLDYLYAQVIDDERGVTLCSVSSLSPDMKKELKSTRSKDAASAVGKAVASKAKAAGISKVVFDRNGYQYHGRIKALADGAREAGLEF